jgi:hypothetical protein
VIGAVLNAENFSAAQTLSPKPALSPNDHHKFALLACHSSYSPSSFSAEINNESFEKYSVEGA